MDGQTDGRKEGKEREEGRKRKKGRKRKGGRKEGNRDQKIVTLHLVR